MKKFIVAVVFFVMATSAFGADSQMYSSDYLYDQGVKAMDKNDWVGTLKYLFAYRVSKGQDWNKLPEDFKKNVLVNIANTEKQLRSASGLNVKTSNNDTGNPATVFSGKSKPNVSSSSGGTKFDGKADSQR